MRDRRKNQEYFDRYLIDQKGRIAAKCEKLACCETNDVEKRQRINLSLLGYRIELLIAEFSNGADTEKLTGIFKDCCRTACDYGKITYETALRLTAMSILLDEQEATNELITQYRDFLYSDKLLRCLAEYTTTGEITWVGNLLYPSVYAPIDKVFSAESDEERINALCNYLAGWYDSCTDAAWYDTADNKYNVYYGYWSFESAALATMFHLNTDRLVKSEYFPVI